MSKEEFILRMNEAIEHIRCGRQIYSCDSISYNFASYYYQTYIDRYYLKSIKHLLKKNDIIINWKMLRVKCDDFKTMKEYRIKWLKDFKETWLKNKFYKEI